MQAQPDLSTQRTGSIPSEACSPEGLCEKIARLETQLPQLGIKLNQFFEALMARRASLQPKESFESPLSVSERKLEILTREVVDIAGRIRRMTGKPEYASERKQLFALYLDLRSQHDDLLGDSMLQQQEEYALELEREEQKFYEVWEYAVQLVRDLVVEVPLRSRGSTPEEHTESKGSSAPATAPEDDACEGPIICSTTRIDTTREEQPEERQKERPGKRKHSLVMTFTANPRPAVSRKRMKTLKSKQDREVVNDVADTPQIDGGKTVTISSLSSPGKLMVPCRVVEHPLKPDEFYILYCSDHDLWFEGDPFPEAERHLEDDHKNVPCVPRATLIDIFGTKVLDCTKRLMKRHNSLVAAHLNNKKQQAEMTQEVEESQARQRDAGETPQDTTSAASVSNMQSRFPPARRSSRKMSTGNGRVTRSKERQFLKPVVGKIYCAKFGDRDHALILLPFGCFKAIGLDNHICGTGLLERSRLKCHDTDPETNDYIWSKGYEDGGPKEYARKYPVLYFDQFSSSFPSHACYDWVSNSDLRKFDIKVSKIPYRDTVIRFIKDQKRIGCNINDDDHTDNQGQRTVNTTPRVPCLRLHDHPDSEVEAYFTGQKGYESSTTTDHDDDEDDSDYEPTDNRDGPRLPGPRDPVNTTQKPAEVAMMGTGTCPEDTLDLTTETSKTDTAQSEQGGNSTVQEAASQKESSTKTSGRQINSMISPVRTQSKPMLDTDAASATSQTDETTSTSSFATGRSNSTEVSSVRQTSHEFSIERNEPPRHLFGTNSSSSQASPFIDARIRIDEQRHQHKLPGISSIMREAGR